MGKESNQMTMFAYNGIEFIHYNQDKFINKLYKDDAKKGREQLKKYKDKIESKGKEYKNGKYIIENINGSVCVFSKGLSVKDVNEIYSKERKSIKKSEDNEKITEKKVKKAIEEIKAKYWNTINKLNKELLKLKEEHKDKSMVLISANTSKLKMTFDKIEYNKKPLEETGTNIHETLTFGLNNIGLSFVNGELWIRDFFQSGEKTYNKWLNFTDLIAQTKVDKIVDVCYELFKTLKVANENLNENIKILQYNIKNKKINFI